MDQYLQIQPKLVYFLKKSYTQTPPPPPPPPPPPIIIARTSTYVKVLQDTSRLNWDCSFKKQEEDFWQNVTLGFAWQYQALLLSFPVLPCAIHSTLNLIDLFFCLGCPILKTYKPGERCDQQV